MHVKLRPSRTSPGKATLLALQVCAALMKWCINKDTFVTNLGDWCLTGTGLQASAAAAKYHYVSRVSDYMLTHFKLFSKVSHSLYT